MKSGSGSRVVFACNGQQARSLSVLDEERLLRDRLCGFSSVTFWWHGMSGPSQVFGNSWHVISGLLDG